MAQLGFRVCANLVMHMDRASLIPAGIDGLKLYLALLVTHLVTAQEFPPTRVAGATRILTHIGIRTHRIAVPNIHRRTRQWRTSIVFDLRNKKRELQRHSRTNRVV